MIHSPLGSKYAIGGALGRSIKRASATPGWWLTGGIPAANCIAAYQPKGAADIAASYVNLASPGTYNATPGTAPSFNTSTGWSFAAAGSCGQYLLTGVTPENDQTWSMIIRFANCNTNSQALAGGMTDGSYGFRISPRRGPADDMVWNNGTQLAAGERQAEGVIAIAGVNGFHNGTDYGDSGGWAGRTPVEIYIGCQNLGGSPNSFITGDILAMAIYDIDISNNIAALTTAMAAL